MSDRYAVIQRFRDGREKEVTSRSTRQAARQAARAIGETHAEIYGYAETRTCDRRSKAFKRWSKP